MTINQLDQLNLYRVCNNDKSAIDWINLGRFYVHLVDDIIDEDSTDKNKLSEKVCLMGAIAIRLYTHEFFLKHKERLAAMMTMCTNVYASSVQYEKSDMAWKKTFSDWARHSWLLVVMDVADICGGYRNVRDIADELWEMSYLEHHKKNGEPT